MCIRIDMVYVHTSALGQGEAKFSSDVSSEQFDRLGLDYQYFIFLLLPVSGFQVELYCASYGDL